MNDVRHRHSFANKDQKGLFLCCVCHERNTVYSYEVVYRSSSGHPNGTGQSLLHTLSEPNLQALCLTHQGEGGGTGTAGDSEREELLLRCDSERDVGCNIDNDDHQYYNYPLRHPRHGHLKWPLFDFSTTTLPPLSSASYPDYPIHIPTTTLKRIKKVTTKGAIAADLRHYLNTRFPKGGVDHDLQNTIRENLYLRTVPVTTRTPRPGEKNGVDYTFLSKEEFIALEKSGELLESGIFDGNHYGTPRPKDSGGNSPHSRGSSSNDSSTSAPKLFPGAHPSSEGKRKRNRSNVEAMSAKHDTSHHSESNKRDQEHEPQDPLGPLPPHWEKAYTEKGEPYFIDHLSGTSHWLDPRLSRIQKKRPEDCSEDELPFGWERIDDPHYGTYYIDHVNRRTQYENPVLVARAVNQSADAIASPNDGTSLPIPPGPGTFPRTKKTQSAFFTRDPNQLRGERIRTQLVKSARGLGFTIVGGDDNVEEFLQIKSVVPNGPAWLDGGLKTGDVLVYVNSTCVLGFTHHDMVTMFQSISTGDIVQLEICRGYPLPFDPDDPNTEIVTTVAVTSPEQGEWAQELEQLQQRQADVQSMPDLSGTSGIANIAPRPGSADLLGDIYPSSKGGSNSDSMSVQITKGGMGFGFTIADSAYGQKVKKILDRARCKNLNEGDVLIEINDINVRNMTHSEVVQVLKNCSRGQEATITVQRGLLSSKESSPSKNKYKKDSFKPKSGFLFRSKTPTAELYSTQEKEKVPNRPKTPLVDTRHMASRSKTPTAAFNEPFSRNDFTRASMGGGSAANNSISTQLGERMDAALRLDNSDNYSRAHSPGRELDTNYGSYSGQHTRGDYQYHHSLLPQENNTTAYGQSEYGGGPYSPSKVGSNDNGNFNGYNNNNPTSSGYDPSYGYTRRTGPPLTGSLPRGRKESTSFEHSEPLPGNLTRWPRPERRATDMLEIAVTLHRQDSGFGFRIVGGTEEGSQVSIGHIVPGGAADLDGRLFSGDEIVAVDNNSVLNSSHHQVVGLMGTAAQNGKVTLTIRRRIYQQDGNGRATETYPYDVAVDRRENEGFGFVIISSVSRSGSTIGRIIPGSPAERCGRLHIGDRILAVNHVDINYMHHGEIVNLIKDSGYSVVLTVGPPIDETSSTTSASHRSSTSSMVTAQATPTVLPPTDSTGSTASVSSNVDPRSVIAGYTYNPYQQQQQQPPPPPPPQQQQQQPPYSPPQQSSQMELYDNSYQTQSQNELVYSYQDQQDQELNRLELDDQYYAVELRRGSRGFGFSIRGGREFQCMPLFVLRIAMDGPAASDGRLRVGDQIIEINGNNTKNMTHSEAIELIKSGGGVVRLLVRRGKMPPAALMEQLSPMAPTPVPSIMSSQQSNALNRPMSAMSQPTTNLGHYSLQQQQQLPTTHPNGNLHNYDNYNYLPNGHLLNGPVSQSSPRDQLYGWQQQQQQQISSLHQQHQS
ncbi:membrane-associated guanylate kinase, WW and PDZ domain-containing protein 1 isoform X6 [Lepeophtheirus salmonis]|uniref:membrane-associated guanylate kinase, WW and PDZ domain-containing protein 1 isoform X6 n=1 Tax=Lepeophtheirus salmonis TaxID=72036 RepID=UPI001AE63B73|nr:membrane-associated guanylate kinase, WW and PDZ domain-containing protein 3-like isoform X1 [Lepeophtheirus salmonis]